MGQRRRRPESAVFKRRRRRVYRNRILLLLVVLLLVGGSVWFFTKKKGGGTSEPTQLASTSEDWIGAPELDVQLLTPNSYSRPQTPLKKINGIVIHYTANPGTGAMANRNYFEGLKDGQGVKASSHFIVGIDGEVVQCIPSTEVAYASNNRNDDTISIECCHPDESGKFNDSTYASVVQLTGWLCVRFNLEATDVIRHYDVTGKMCPKYFVENEDAWKQFKDDVKDKIEEIKKLQQV